MKKSGFENYPGLGGKKPSGPSVVVEIGAGKGEKEDPTRKACREFFEAAGIEPADEEAACEALVALVDIRMESMGGETEEEPEEEVEE